MDTFTIDIELEHYYGERVAMNSREACCRLYVRATSRFHGAELEKYLQRVRTHARVYASLSRMFRSPLCHVETPLFLSGLILFTAGIGTALFGTFSPLVAGGTSAGLVGMIACGRKLLAIRQQYAVREAVFLELAERLPEN